MQSQLVVVSRDPVKGRCLVASEAVTVSVATHPDQPAPPPLLTEAPYTHVATCGDVCDSCMRRSSDLQQCTVCKLASYCSKACQTRAWKAWHKKECKVVAAVRAEHSTVPTPTLLMAFRFVAKDTGDVFRELSGDEGMLDTEQREMYSQLGVLLVSMLRRANLQAPCGDIVTLFAKLGANTFSVVDPSDFGTTGYALYRTAAAANHSCTPNAVVSFSGGVVQLRPLRSLKKGDEVCVSYVELASHTSHRRAELLGRYGFQCSCARCTDWGEALEQQHDPTALASGNDQIEDLIARGGFEEALQLSLSLVPHLALYSTAQTPPQTRGHACPVHPAAGAFYLNIAKLRWYLQEDAKGTLVAALKAVSVLRVTQCPDSPMLRSALELAGDAHQLVVREENGI